MVERRLPEHEGTGTRLDDALVTRVRISGYS
jgi:hypothetical protein